MIRFLFSLMTLLPGLFFLCMCTHESPTGSPDPSVPGGGDTSTRQSPFVERAREYTFDFYDGKFASLQGHFSEAMKDAVDSAGFAAFHAEFRSVYGKEASLLFEDVDSASQPFTAYFRAVRFSNRTDSFIVEWDLEGADTVVGFFLNSLEVPEPNPGYRTKTDLYLPFSGEWMVIWGGRYLYQNQHNGVANQYYAYDFRINRDRQSHSGDGTANAQYFCFNAPVLAPGAGRVIEVENGIEDNLPGARDTVRLAGNHVIIDHGGGEYSMLAHFKKGSIAVRPGDSVSIGSEIGRCGNSGNSSEPHLHFQMQNAAGLLQSTGLPTQFRDYIADGIRSDRGEPVRGQRVRNAALP
jgi:murein DD-endopeptidase MepM/ murein hydrolase activator NlpD